MRISPINTYQYRNNNKAQRTKTNPSFQAWQWNSMKNQKPFQILEYYNKKCEEKVTRETMKEYLKQEFGGLDMNVKNSSGNTPIIELVKQGYWSFMSTLGHYEDEGALEKIDWNATDYNGDNILMIAMKSKGEAGSFAFGSLVSTLDYFAKKGKFDINAVHPYTGETPLTWAIKNKGGWLVSSLSYAENIDMSFAPQGEEAPIIQAIKNMIVPHAFKKIITSSSVDVNKLDIKEILNLIKAIPRKPEYYYRYDRDAIGLEDREIKEYLEAVEIALAMQGVKDLKSVYEKEGVFTLEQIEKAVNQIGTRDTINTKLNDIDENIGHFFAETYVDHKNYRETKKADEIATKLRKSYFHFGDKDAVGRTPLMIALEAENFVVAKAILENTHPSEIKYCPNMRCSTGIWEDYQASEKEVRALIDNLEPEKREEFTKLLDERMNDYREFR